MTREEWARIQKWCPYCGKRISENDAGHHWLIGRMKGFPQLDEWGVNRLLCHNNSCHTPEPPELGYKCAKFAFTQLGISPDSFEAWRGGLGLKSRPAFPEFYYTARYEVFGY